MQSTTEKTVTVYIVPSSVACTATFRNLENHGIDPEIKDISVDEAALEVVKKLGYLQAPVVVVGDAHWAGFRPDLIKKHIVDPSRELAK